MSAIATNGKVQGKSVAHKDTRQNVIPNNNVVIIANIPILRQLSCSIGNVLNPVHVNIFNMHV